MSDVRVRVSAVKDRSVDTVFRSLEDQAKRAATTLSKSAEKGAGDLGKSTKRGVSEAEKAIRLLEREFQNELPKSMDAGVKASVEFGKKASASFAATRAEFNAMARDVEKNLDKMSRAQRGFDGTKRDANGRFVGSSLKGRNVAAGVGRAGRAAMNIAQEMAMGAGFDPSFGAAISRATSMESKAVALSNSGFMPGAAGANGQRQDPHALIEQAKKVANETAFDPAAVLEGLQKFVAKTGDLQTGRDALKDMAVLSKATGAELDDMVDAAGDVANALGDTDNKGAKVKAVMTAIAAQGKEGAVEIKDLAKQMAKIGASAGTFEGDPTRVIASMGALAQMSRAKGGSASATQAATSVTSFMNTFSKGARLDKFEQFGVAVNGKSGKVRDAGDIIVDAIRAASSAKNGGMAAMDRNMGKMFMDVRARSVTRGFETIYKEAGGGEEGIKAVRAAYDHLVESTMKATEVQESFRRAMSTTESQAQLVNNEMTNLATMTLPLVKEGFLTLAPAIKGVIGWFGEITGLTEQNKQKDAVPKELQAVNDAARLREVQYRAHHGEKGIPVAGDVFDKTDESAKNLEEVIQSRSKDAATLRAKIGNMPKKYGQAYEEDSAKLAQMDRQVAMDKETLQDLRTAQSGVLSLLRDGIVVKEIQKLPPGFLKPPKADDKGTNGPKGPSGI